jgi:hypothetical protein
MGFNDLTEEQKAKALACKSSEELRALVEAEGIELSDEQLGAVSGGWTPCGELTCGKYTC